MKLDYKNFDYIIINICYGGFGVSDKALKDLGISTEIFLDSEKLRTNKELIELLIKKGSEYCSNRFAKLALVKIPKGTPWEISDYDGIESLVMYLKVEEVEIPD